MDLPEYAGALRRRWLWPAILALLGLGLAAAWAATAEPVHRSTATLYYAEPQRNLTAPAARLTSFAILATSDHVLDGVRTTLGPQLTAGGSSDDLRDRVHATIDPETAILTITATDSSASGARALAEETSRRLIALVDALRATPGGHTEGRLRLGDPATVAVNATAARTARTVALGGLLGLLVGILLALLREAVDPRLRHPDEVRRLAPRWQVLALRVGDEQSATPAAAARFRAVRTAIVDATDRPRVLVVTSAEDDVTPRPAADAASAGAATTTPVTTTVTTTVSTTVSTIADAVAQGAAREAVNVILMSAQVHADRSAVPVWALAEPGLIAVLRGRSGLAGVVTASPLPGLRLVPAGLVGPLPEAVLTSKAMREVVDDLRSRSELLIIDAPPLVSAPPRATTPVAPAARQPPPDTLGLVRTAQAGVLLVVRGGTHRRTLRALVRLLEAERDGDVTRVQVLFLSPPPSRPDRRRPRPDAARSARASTVESEPLASVAGS